MNENNSNEQISDEDNLNSPEINEILTNFTTDSNIDDPQNQNMKHQVTHSQNQAIGSPNVLNNIYNNNQLPHQPLQEALSNNIDLPENLSCNLNSKQQVQEVHRLEQGNDPYDVLFFFHERLSEFVSPLQASIPPQNEDQRKEKSNPGSKPDKEVINNKSIIPTLPENNHGIREAVGAEDDEEIKEIVKEKLGEENKDYYTENLAELNTDQEDQQDQQKEKNNYGEEEMLEHNKLNFDVPILSDNAMELQRNCQTTEELRRKNSERKSELSHTSDKKHITEASAGTYYSEDYLKNSEDEEAEESEPKILAQKSASPRRKPNPNSQGIPRIDEENDINSDEDAYAETNTGKFQIQNQEPHVQDSVVNNQNDKKNKGSSKLSHLTYKVKERIYKQFLSQYGYNERYNESVIKFKLIKAENKKKEFQSSIHKASNKTEIQINKEEEKNIGEEPIEPSINQTAYITKEKRDKESININDLTVEKIKFFIDFIKDDSYQQNIKKFMSESQILLKEFDDLAQFGHKITLEKFKEKLMKYFLGEKLKEKNNSKKKNS